MGNQAHSYYAIDFHNRYKFIQFVSDPNFGQIKVYRKTNLNFDYVMILDKYLDNHEMVKLENNIKTIINSYSSQNQTLLLKIYNYQVIPSELTNCNMAHMKLYIQYLNYSFHEFLEDCMRKRESLSYQEILYVLNCVVQIYELCEGFDYNFFNCCSRGIFLTPEGYLKFIPLQLKNFYQDGNGYCNTFLKSSQKQNLKQYQNEKYFIKQLKTLFNEILALNSNLNKNSLIGIRTKETSAIKMIWNCVSSIRSFKQFKKILPKAEVNALIIRRKSQTCSQVGYIPKDYVPLVTSLKVSVNKSKKGNIRSTFSGY